MKKLLICCLLACLFIACKQEIPQKNDVTSKAFAELLANYNEEGFALNPIVATNAGDFRFNDQFPNFLSDEYQQQLKTYYTKYSNALKEIDEKDYLNTIYKITENRNSIINELNIYKS